MTVAIPMPARISQRGDYQQGKALMAIPSPRLRCLLRQSIGKAILRHIPSHDQAMI
jgi:hypothetical protein